LMTESQKVHTELLSTEEVRIFEGFVPYAEEYSRLAKGLLERPPTDKAADTAHKRVVLRFVKAVPAIIGADMKTYGPFMVEDVASVHVDNARILVKQGLAVMVETF